MLKSMKLLVAAAALPLAACSQSDLALTALTQNSPAIQSDTTAPLEDLRTHSVVSLFKFDGENIAFACSGVVISKNLVLTAGHCIRVGKNLDQRMPKDSLIIANFAQKFDFKNDLQTLENESLKDDGPMRAAGVDNIRVHPNYKGGSYCIPGVPKYDLALIRLNAPIPSYAKEIKPLQEKSSIRRGREVFLFGFGPTDDDAKANTVVERTMTTLIEELIGSENRIEVRLNRNFTIAGDSGGPAFIDQDGVPLVAGILSCSGDAYAHAHYESVAHHIDWIRSAAAELGAPLE